MFFENKLNLISLNNLTAQLLYSTQANLDYLQEFNSFV